MRIAAIPMTMQAVVLSGYGASDNLAVQTIPVPKPTKTQILVRVEAASLNALDWHFRTGKPYFMRLTEGLTPKRTVLGADVAGVVVAVGADVTRLAVGDAVFGECDGGGFAEYTAVEQDTMVHKPESVSFHSAAATPVAGLTALQGLRTHTKVQPGDRVLINGGAGGVGTFANQIAKALGGRVTTVCSTRNVEMLEALGVDHVIDYNKVDFVQHGGKYDVIYDNVGNRNPKEILSLLEAHSRYVVITGPKHNRWVGPVPALLKSALRFLRAKPSFHQFTASANVEDLEFLADLLQDGSVVPQIQRVVGLSEVAAGIDELATGHTRAKIVVEPR